MLLGGKLFLKTHNSAPFGARITEYSLWTGINAIPGMQPIKLGYVSPVWWCDTLSLVCVLSWETQQPIRGHAFFGAGKTQRDGARKVRKLFCVSKLLNIWLHGQYFSLYSCVNNKWFPYINRSHGFCGRNAHEGQNQWLKWGKLKMAAQSSCIPFRGGT